MNRPVVEINLLPSRSLLMLLAGLAGASLILLCRLSLPFCVKFILFVLIIIWAISVWQQQKRITGLATDGLEWDLVTCKGRLSGKLCGDSTLTAWIMLLRLSFPGRRRKRTLILLPDILSRTNWRRLRILAGQPQRGRPGKKA